jgi:hypothetical protein
VLRDPTILAENVYNMDETGVMLSMLSSVEVLVCKDDKRKHRGARVKRTTVTATQLSLTKSALQQNHIQLLMAVNNEAKPRRAIKADILEKGSGQVFTYKHLQEKRSKRGEESAAKDAKAKARRDRKSKSATQKAVEAMTSASTVKRGRKRKSTALEVEANSPNVEAGPSVRKGKVARVSGVQTVEAAGALWLASVAKMY